ncbi:YqjD family protein [Aquamicrobium segne]|uniref:YqjD family protein n=1 Tax=Aquamicrobium segne TaxID=469547 RepID=A0ABW0H3P8_9HYPH
MMAATPKSTTEPKSTADLEADIAQLKADIENLSKQLSEAGQKSYDSASKVAAKGVEHLRAQGEAAMESIKGNAQDFEEQMLVTIREKPVTSLAVAAGLGFLIGLVSRR